MPLQKQPIDVPFAKGLNQKVDSRLLQVGSQTTLSNFVQDKIGQLTARPGTVDFGTGSVSTWGRTLNPATNGNVDARLVPSPIAGVAQINNFRLWQRSPLSSNDTKAYDIDDVTNILVQRYGVVVSPQALTSFDWATDGTKALFIWVQRTALGTSDFMYLVLDASTLATVVTPQRLTSVPAPCNAVRCASVSAGGRQSVVAVVAQSANTLTGVTFNLTTLTWSGAATLATDCNTSTAGGTSFGLFDVGVIDVSHAVMTYGTTANPPVVKTTSYNLTAWSVVATQSTTPPGSTGMHIYGITCNVAAGGSTWIAYAVGSGPMTIRAFALHTANIPTVDVADTSLWTDSAAVVWNLGILSSPTGVASGVIVVGSLAGNATATLNWANFTTSATVLSLRTRYGLALAAKPFNVTGKNMALVQYAEADPGFGTATVSRTYYVVELVMNATGASIDLRPLATVAPRIAQSPAFNTALVPNAISPNFPDLGTRILTIGSTIRSAQGGFGIDIVDVKYAPSLWQPASLGGVTYLSGGIPCAWDGERVTEIGFLYQPPPISAGVAGGGSVGPASGSYVYTYSVVYEWRDNTGQRCQSRPTSTTASCTSNTNAVTITVPPMNLSLRQDFESSYSQQIAIAIYRDTSTSPGNQVRVFQANVPTALLNVYQSASFSYVDTASDAIIAANEPLYTSGGAALDAVCPSSLSSLIMHNNRLFGVGDDGVSIWYTTTYDGGSTQPYFNDDLILLVPQRATALASMDGKLIAFASDSIYLFTGDGPTNAGLNDTWSPPQKLQVDVGCSSDWRSVVGFSGGIVFQDGSKLYLLSRSLEASYFSGPIEDTLAANPVVTSATLYAARNELRFTLKPSDTASTGVVANYNYVTDTWSTFSYYDQDAGSAGADVDTSIVVGNTWYHANLSGRVWSESSTANGYDVDSVPTNHWITCTVATANMKPSAVQGFGRLWGALIMAQQVSPHDITIQAAFNYSDSYTDSRTYTALTQSSYTTPQRQHRIGFTQQKCEAVRIQISITAPTGVAQTTGFGANLIAVTINAAVKPGSFPVPAVQGA